MRKPKLWGVVQCLRLLKEKQKRVKVDKRTPWRKRKRVKVEKHSHAGGEWVCVCCLCDSHGGCTMCVCVYVCVCCLCDSHGGCTMCVCIVYVTLMAVVPCVCVLFMWLSWRLYNVCVYVCMCVCVVYMTLMAVVQCVYVCMCECVFTDPPLAWA